MANRVVKVNIPKIRELAEKKKITSLTELEAAAGLSNGAIGKWTNCDARIDSLYRVAKVLKVKVDTLIEEKV